MGHLPLSSVTHSSGDIAPTPGDWLEWLRPPSVDPWLVFIFPVICEEFPGFMRSSGSSERL